MMEEGGGETSNLCCRLARVAPLLTMSSCVLFHHSVMNIWRRVTEENAALTGQREKSRAKCGRKALREEADRALFGGYEGVALQRQIVLGDLRGV